MKINEEIIKKTKDYALDEIGKYGTPKKEHFELANKKGQELAEKLNADKDIVMLGTILMDLKIGECVSEDKISEHVKRSSDSTREFLDKFNLGEEIIEKIINCVDAHHGEKDFIYKEAEICANADCYRFLHPRGIFGALILFGRRNESVDFCLDNVEKKMQEKYNILSLDICKKELEGYYQTFKKLIKEAQEVNN